MFMQDKLQNLAAGHSDILETLSPKVRKRVEVLREIQVSLPLNAYDCYFALVYLSYIDSRHGDTVFLEKLRYDTAGIRQLINIFRYILCILSIVYV